MQSVCCSCRIRGVCFLCQCHYIYTAWDMWRRPYIKNIQRQIKKWVETNIAGKDPYALFYSEGSGRPEYLNLIEIHECNYG
jgi:hypothetical protein